MTHYHQVSGGGGSWLAALLDMRAHPDAEHRFVFADTLYEDADAYRFLLEGVAALTGAARDWIPGPDDFPDYRVAGEFDIASYHGNPQWRGHLAMLRSLTAAELPDLVWLVEGRDPWEVFRDRRFLGNSRHDPCSKHLKRDKIDAWRDANCDPAADVFTVGIGPEERHRFEGGKGKRGLRARTAADGWTYTAPLLEHPEGDFGPWLFMSKLHLRKPRLYRFYVHNNCGGFCIKAGHAHYKDRFHGQPERFAYDVMMEAKLAAFLGRPVSMMTDRRGGEKRPYPLAQFRDDVAEQLDGDLWMDAVPGDSGCGCMVDE